MSFYSALVLAANDGVLPPTPEAIHSLFSELGLLNSRYAGDEFGNLADHITALFRDSAALAENSQFFAPDSIGFAEGVEICTPEGDYTGPG